MKVKIPLVIIFLGLVPANLCHLKESSARSILDHHQHFSSDDIAKENNDGLDYNMGFDSILNYFLKSSGAADQKRKRSERGINSFLSNLLGFNANSFERKFARNFNDYAKRGLGTNEDGIYEDDRDFFRSLLSNFEENGYGNGNENENVNEKENKNKKRVPLYQKWSPKIEDWENNFFRSLLKNDKLTNNDFFRNHGRMKHY